MNLWEMVRVALEGIWANKLRSILTMLGIIIGVLAVIIVITLGQGVQEKIKGELEGFGTNLFIIFVGQVDGADYDQYKIDPEEAKIIKESVDSIKALAPVGSMFDSVQSRRTKKSSTIVGTEASYAEIHNVAISKGRFFSSVDAVAGRRVIVINQKLADDMFGAAGDVVGQKLILGSTPVTVCGVTKNQFTMLTGGQESPIAYIPLKLYFALSSANGVWELDGTAVSRDKVEEVSKQAIRILELRHRGQIKKVYQVFNMEQQADIANKAMAIVTMFISAIAGISLLVGGIGIMNIMLVSVTERTREIGVRMALGARRQDILVQFLIESMVLSLTGGLIGIGLGLGITALLCAALEMPLIFSFPVVIGAVIFSMAVGVFFGLYPANRAAKLDPIDALRYE